jgi:glutathione synthase/RimK-type ligase-like ATP-grasp enzyme
LMNLPRILIPTYPGDVHAVEVALALADRGHEALLWYGSDFPLLQTASIDIRDSAVGWEVSGPDLQARGPFDVLWMRRPTPPVLPETLHPGDLPVARREWQDFLGGLYHLAAPDAFWVNPLASRFRADLKPVQLREAARAGLTVPPTRMSNDPVRIRSFLEEFRGRTVYKPFYPAQWNHDAGAAVLLTSDITVDDLPDDETLRLTPGIFQVKVEKSHELRVTILGEHVVTARLLSQESEVTRVDWRAAGPRVRVEPDRLPEEVQRACLRLMRSLGIVFGAFDFIVTPAGEHVFLEVNPAGQFLWVEESCPELRLLAPFVDFLAARRPDFRWPEEAPGAIRHQDYRQAATGLIDASMGRHTRPTEVFLSSDEPDPGTLTASRRSTGRPPSSTGR